MPTLPVGERETAGSAGDLVWIDGSGAHGGGGDPASGAASIDLKGEYPALAELVGNLHALPFELNRALAERDEAASRGAHATAAGEAQRGGRRLRLTVALPGSTGLLRLRPGCRQPPRVDCNSGRLSTGAAGAVGAAGAASAAGGGGKGGSGGTDDSGHRVTALYFLPPSVRPSVHPSVHPSSTASAPGGQPVHDVGKGGGDGASSGGGDERFGGGLRLQNAAAAALAPAAAAVAAAPSSLEQGPSAGAAAAVGAVGDRLVLWRSDLVRNERERVTTPAQGQPSEAADLFALVFWMHGVEHVETQDEPKA